jgi:hypothetical protein
MNKLDFNNRELSGPGIGHNCINEATICSIRSTALSLRGLEERINGESYKKGG